MIKGVSIRVDVAIDFKFWHLVPSININLHTHELEFEWLCLGIYAGCMNDRKKTDDLAIHDIVKFQDHQYVQL